ncbi:hypothetical protein KA005_00565 [bacterium]|nr:hypothetical protein [bacterium]
MEPDVAVVLASGKAERFRKALQAVCEQTMPFKRVVVVPWGGESKEVEEIAKCRKIPTQIVSPSRYATFEENRNNALSVIATNPPEWVAFIDDDTIIDRTWAGEMITGSKTFGNKCAFASVVTSASHPDCIQSAGHVLSAGRPLDCGYRWPLSAKDTLIDPLCPCANSAFVPWRAIERISKLDESVWDPRFQRWQTCFDFGLKVRLVDFGCRLVRSAVATHEGAYERKGVLQKDDVKGQLRSRILLYDKFYPKQERTEAMDLLAKKRVYGRWKEAGYPNARWLRGEEMVATFQAAMEEERKLREGMGDVYLRKIESLDTPSRRSLLFG